MIWGTGKTISQKLPQYDTCVLSKSGYRISDATDDLPSVLGDQTNKDVVALHVWTNDVVKHTHEELVVMYGRLLEKAKCAAPHSPILVTAISSIINLGLSLNNKVESLNKSLCVIMIISAFSSIATLVTSNTLQGRWLAF